MQTVTCARFENRHTGIFHTHYALTSRRVLRFNTMYNAALRAHGVFKSPGKLYPSLAITQADLDLTHEAISKAVAAVHSVPAEEKREVHGMLLEVWRHRVEVFVGQ